MNFNTLIVNIKNVQETMHASAAHAINTALTIRNWMLGYYIVEFEQNGEDRAAYGENLLQNLEKQLKTKGLTERRFREFRRFYQIYPHIGVVLANILPQEQIRRLITAELNFQIRRLSTAELKGVPSELLIKKLSYTHLYEIAQINDEIKRRFYEIECIKGHWSVAELKRQIHSLYFERSGLSKNKEALSTLVNNNSVPIQANDIINSPIALEFLNLNEKALITESDLEQAILDNLQNFLLEMGHGFCFEARQKRIIIDNDYFFVDLVFYHRILKCHVLVELKVDKFNYEHSAQLNMYLNYFKHEIMTTGDNPPIGILLCTEKGNTQVEYATGGLDNKIFVQKYLVELPDKKELEEYITKEIKGTIF
ncbi:MAG: PDDEXK nuclease domain-containing protein [Bacteroidales bacterium]|jgi:predicted nuclease of restriction endonuclease-like (RecB) superfamily|nr:PDDEXK nuclease domain-containing protein [Bacteroidales bacterium]